MSPAGPKVSTRFSSPLATLLAVATWPARVVAARRVRIQMGAMSDHELRDIGLIRQDVYDATALPLATDPGRLYAERALERRMARHADESDDRRWDRPPMVRESKRSEARSAVVQLMARITRSRVSPR